MDFHDDVELIREFVTESIENLDEMEPVLLAWEKGDVEPGADDINGVFRAIHSIKGASGFLGFEKIQKLSHVLENLLMKVRDREIKFDTSMIDVLLPGLDKIRLLLEALPGDDSAISIVGELNNLEEFLSEGNVMNQTGQIEKVEQDVAIHQHESVSVVDHGLPVFPKFATDPEVLNAKRSCGMSMFVFVLPAEGQLSAEQTDAFFANVESLGEFIAKESFVSATGDSHQCALFTSVLEKDLLEVSIEQESIKIVDFTDEMLKATASAVAVQEAVVPTKVSSAKDVKTADAPAAASKASNESADTVRVNVDLLDNLVNLAGELVLSRNQLLQVLEPHEIGGLSGILQDVDMVTSELQEHIMLTRMQPIGNVFGKFQRVVRNLSKSLGKTVDLAVHGQDVQLDKSIIEVISDPLTHLVRNSVDHGIESAEARQTLGKPATGHVLLRAYHESGQVNIEISDDGKGIDPVQMREVAVRKGLFDEEQAAELSDQEALQLIFHPGFSTATEVTDVSGRGVGMDVVKTNIERVGGHIDVQSELGIGTVINLRLPLTLAIISALIISVREELFALPQVSIVELVRIKAEDVADRIEEIKGAKVLRLRGHLLPLVDLSEVLGVPATEDSEENIEQAPVMVVVLQSGFNQYGLIVGGVRDIEEIVVKSLSSYAKSCRIYAGATIMGNGTVAMILDVAGLESVAKLKFSDADSDQLKAKANAQSEQRLVKQSVLLFTNAADESFAMPLNRIKRIEKISATDLEQIGDKYYMQYLGKGLPVVKLEEMLPVRPYQGQWEEAFVLVPNMEYDAAGILAIQVLDTLETEIELDTETIQADGIKGSAYVNEKLTLFLDVDLILKKWQEGA